MPEPKVERTGFALWYHESQGIKKGTAGAAAFAKTTRKKFGKGKFKTYAAQHAMPDAAILYADEDVVDDVRGELLELMEMLTYCRMKDGKAEAMFIEKYIDTIKGMQVDGYGNRYIVVGPDNPDVMFSAHTDTVHRHSGWQSLHYDGRHITLQSPEHSNCLGADDGAGVFCLVKLIAAGIAGLYVFHRAEEHGGLGSGWIADNAPDMVKDIKFCIAFDRRGADSIITEQGMTRCCSDDFADSLADALSLPMYNDPTGSFTDSATYADAGLIGECTNVSVGYDNEHTSSESLDVAVLFRLINAFRYDWKPDMLKYVREPQAASYGYTMSYSMSWDKDYEKSDGGAFGKAERLAYDRSMCQPHFMEEDKATLMLEAVNQYPEAAAQLLMDYGVSDNEVYEAADAMLHTKAWGKR